MSEPNEIEKALRALSEAHGPSALAHAFGQLQRKVLKSRNAEKKEYGVLAQTFAAAMQIWDRQKEQGVSRAEREHGLEQSLRAAWPQVREWKYLCQKCDDVGWIFGTCTLETPCGRPFTLPASQSHYTDYTGQGRCSLGHSYVSPCVCSRGDAHRRQMYPSQAAPEDFTKSGKTSKPTRFGR